MRNALSYHLFDKRNFTKSIFVSLLYGSLIIGCALDTIFGYVPLYSRDASYFAGVTYTSSVLVVIFLVLFDLANQKANETSQQVSTFPNLIAVLTPL